MELFQIIDGAHAILFSRGVYKQSKVFRRGTAVFAQSGSGFVRLLQGGSTTAPAIAWKDVEGDGISRTEASKAPVWVG